MRSPAFDPSIPELQEAMQAGRLTAVELTRYYLERIERYDRAGPQLNSVLEINPDALSVAQALDQERAERRPRGPLHGIPVILKDNIDTADRMHTSAGSLAMKDSIAPRDAFLVKKLREAGAVLLGKANMTEWANFMTIGMPPGYSSRGGQVINPYGTAFHPGGSSRVQGSFPSHPPRTPPVPWPARSPTPPSYSRSWPGRTLRTPRPSSAPTPSPGTTRPFWIPTGSRAHESGCRARCSTTNRTRKRWRSSTAPSRP